VDDKLGQLGGLLCDFSNASGSVLSNLDIHIFQAVQNSWEDFSFNNDFGKIDSVFCNLSKALTNVSLKLSIWVGNQGSKVWYCTLINYGLGKLLGMLGNFTESSS